MRIIAGERKGFRLSPIRTKTIRPTADRTREMIFNVLSDDVKDSLVLDIYAGSGSLGIEALSRGAVKAIFIENHRKALEILTRNLELTGFAERAEIVNRRAKLALRQVSSLGIKFNLIFADPPYGGNRNQAQETLTAIDVGDFLQKDGWFVLEHHYKQQFDVPDRLKLHVRKRMGDTGVSFYRYG